MDSWVEFDPWGGKASGSTTSQRPPHRYTTYERDANGGDEAMFRRYESKWQRFAQPDPYDGSYNLTDPQSFNRYSYVLNDPVNFSDPSGLMPLVCTDAWCGYGNFSGWGGGWDFNARPRAVGRLVLFWEYGDGQAWLAGAEFFGGDDWLGYAPQSSNQQDRRLVLAPKEAQKDLKDCSDEAHRQFMQRAKEIDDRFSPFEGVSILSSPGVTIGGGALGTWASIRLGLSKTVKGGIIGAVVSEAANAAVRVGANIFKQAGRENQNGIQRKHDVARCYDQVDNKYHIKLYRPVVNFPLPYQILMFAGGSGGRW